MDRQESAGPKHERLKELEITPRTWIYTQSLSDGRTFVQALQLDADGNTNLIIRNASLEAYTKERAWWIRESVLECSWLTDMKGLEEETAGLLNAIPAQIVEGKLEVDGAG